MKINSVSCKQFAGLRNKEVRFEDGLNIVYGNNETGKSTLVGLIYRTLFQESKLGRRNTEFQDQYFPADVKGGFSADFADGTVEFENENRVFKVYKKWNYARSECELDNGKISIADEEKIAEILKQELLYGRGIYDEMIFASQKNQDHMLMTLLDDNGRKKNAGDSELRQELTSVVTKAVLESGGVSIEKLEKAIDARIEGAGSRWDEERNYPEGGKNKVWKRNVGSILNAYYEMSSVKSKMEDVLELENRVTDIIKGLEKLSDKRNGLTQDYKELSEFAATLKNIANVRKLKKNSEDRLSALEKAAVGWPEAEKKLKKVKELKQEAEKSRINELYDRAHAADERIKQQEKKLEDVGIVSAQDAELVQRLDIEIQKLLAKLSGMNVSAQITVSQGTDVNVTSAADGEVIDISQGTFDITEAVSISVPDVLELKLSPSGVDAGAVKAEVKKAQEDIQAVFDRYSVKSPEELKAKAAEYDKLSSELSGLKNELERILDGQDFEELSAAAEKTEDVVRKLSEVNAELSEICEMKQADRYIGAAEAEIQAYTDNYQSLDKIAEDAANIRKELEKFQQNLAAAEEIPEKFRNMTNPDAELERLLEEKEAVEGRILDSQRDMAAAETELKAMGSSTEELGEILNQKEKEFAEKKDEYLHWKHIKEAFLELKDQSYENPMQDIEKNFEKYLGIITNNSVTLENIDDRFNVQIFSNDFLMDYDKLSEGTKDTISLAFRLAMLEYLYPDGDGLVIFDDSFNDMDNERKQQSCRLIEEFAKKNQVIFVTCDSQYMQMLQGNVIMM